MEMTDSEADLMAKENPDEFVFVDNYAQETFGQQLNILRRNREFCDVTLQVGQHEIAGHKCVLALASPRFFQMFSKEPRPTFELDVLGLEYEPVEALVEFAYTCRLTAKPETAKALFKTAAKLQMERVVHALGDFLIQHVTVQSCIGVRSIINREYTAALADKIDLFIKENFAEAILTPEFIALPRVQIEVIQKSEQEASHTNEFQLCQMGVDWIRKCLVDDQWDMSALTEKVHLLFVKGDDNILHDCVELDELDENEKGLNRETFVQDYKIMSKNKAAPQHKNGSKSSRANSLNRNPARARQLLFSGNSNGHLIQNEDEVDIKWKLIAAMPTAERTHIALTVADRQLISLSVVQRIAANISVSTVESVAVPEENGQENVLNPLAPMKAPRCAFGAASFESKIIVVGGYNRGECLDSMEIFDSVANCWSTLPSMSTPRARFDIAIVKGTIFAVCGSDGTKDLQTAECYTSDSEIWQSIASLSSARSSAGVCALDGRALCIGGWSGQTVLKCVDAYDPDVDQWLPYAPLQTGRSQAGIDILDGRIYVVGGCDNWDRLNTVEVYDPRADSWSFVAPLQTARRGAGVTHRDGKLYVIGGSDGTQSLCSVEIYDPRLNRWIPGPSLSISRANLEAVELEGTLFALGGYSGKTFLNSMEVLRDAEWTEFISQ
ncbi:influenza virus NS1A-binding protein homolog [Paramacrobiotus metropolitanus]|uniref:influenza virus NS1A-binding protein homolog n=1 Tax=Paramacrobiotus metropolitanus TaxID=2943436 RepID=UPI0024457195|nr:influenza virus NS1A-binding protein homolog [Paramacrobiotus metropolitanus]